jgi:quercetin dioxygenase-like cupin family protein
VITVLRGTGLGRIGELEKQLSCGDVMFVPKNTLHSVENTSREQELWISWSFTPVGEGFAQSIQNAKAKAKENA